MDNSNLIATLAPSLSRGSAGQKRRDFVRVSEWLEETGYGERDTGTDGSMIGFLGPQKMAVLTQPAAVEMVIGDDLGNAAPETGGMVPFYKMG